jgi:pSer/pThr/pTyr-binding forkhead associated (FHA) protein
VLTRRLTVVGRRKPAAISLASPSVSLCHSVLCVDSGELWVIDLVSKNGLRMGNQKMEVVRLPVGSSLRLGVFELAFSRLTDSRETEYVLRRVHDPRCASSAAIGPPDGEQPEAEAPLPLRQLEMERRLGAYP